MRRPQVKVTGSIGRWTAEADGETLPVLHSQHWDVRSGNYLDPMKGVSKDRGKWPDYVARLHECDRVIIQKDTDPDTLRRDGYIGVFRFTNLDVREDGSIALRIIERLADAKR